MPEELKPELATLVDQAPGDHADWVFEIKFDGYRMLARVEGKKVQLITRNGNDWTAKLQALQAELARMKLPDGWYDGEIVVHDDDGKPDFGLLQTAFDGSNTAHIIYFLFDVPYLHGYDLRDCALVHRRAALHNVLDHLKSDIVRFSDEFGNDPQELVLAACRMGLEGVIGKRRDSRYTCSGARPTGSSSNAASGRNSSSAATPTRKARASASARCCWARTMNTACCNMRAMSAPVSMPRC